MELFNRELSWLSFNERVLQESLDISNPLIERIRFLGIYSNNLDEFFRVRVATIRRMVALGTKKVEGHKGGPKSLLKAIKKTVIDQQQLFQLSYEMLLKHLREEHILQTDESHLKEPEIEKISDFFENQVRPHIVPIILSSKTAFPQLQDDGIYLAIKITSYEKSKVKYALIQIPDAVSRFFIIPASENEVQKVILLDDIIRFHLESMFSIFTFDKIEAFTFKITRDAELDLDDGISKSFLEKMKTSVEMRKAGETVRFVYDSAMPLDLLSYLMNAMGLEAGENIIPGGRYHNFKDFMNFPDFGRPEFVYPKAPPVKHPAFTNNKSLIKTVLSQDVMITYPYQTFQHTIDVLREAAIDPKVVSIKINVYRVASNSQIINALISAAKNGKKVQVVIELLARFDEKNNIYWSNYLEEHGVTVLFGVQNLKVHSKLFIIKRKSGNKIQSIAHIGTGNFHEKTAKVYTDCSLLTADPSITKEVDKVFKIFKNNFDRSAFRELMVSPFNTRRKINSLIDKEIENAKKDEEAYIYLKINNLVDSKIIKKLYEASNAGVKIHCLVRGICALVPKIKDLSENIEVRSIVGRYLEHSRIMIFANGGNEKYFISSADWMGRNLDNRIEVTTPIHDKSIQKDLKFMIEAGLNDNQKSRVINSTQKNHSYDGGEIVPYYSQEEIYKYFKKKLKNK